MALLDLRSQWEASSGASGTAAVSFTFSEALAGSETVSGTAAVAFGFSEALAGSESVSASGAVAFGFSVSASGSEAITGTVAESFGFSVAAQGTETGADVSGTVAIAFGFSAAGASVADQPLGSLHVAQWSTVRRELEGHGGVLFRFTVEAEASQSDDDLVLLLAA